MRDSSMFISFAHTYSCHTDCKRFWIAVLQEKAKREAAEAAKAMQNITVNFPNSLHQGHPYTQYQELSFYIMLVHVILYHFILKNVKT